MCSHTCHLANVLSHGRIAIDRRFLAAGQGAIACPRACRQMQKLPHSTNHVQSRILPMHTADSGTLTTDWASASHNALQAGHTADCFCVPTQHTPAPFQAESVKRSRKWCGLFLTKMIFEEEHVCHCVEPQPDLDQTSTCTLTLT